MILMKFPLLTAMELVKILHKMGFELQRQRGSHMIFRHPDGRTVVVPNHPSEKLDRGLLRKIVKKDLDMSREEFLKYI